MKITFRLLLAILIGSAMPDRLDAFNFNTNTHMQVYYDYCEEDVLVSFVYGQTAGIDDRMNYMYFRHNPASGAPVTLIDFRHESQYNNTTGWTPVGSQNPSNKFGYKILNPPGHAWFIVLDHIWDENDHEGHKFWVRFRLRALPQSVFETFSCAGFWNGSGSNSPDFQINTTHPLSLYRPDTPSSLTASQGACQKVDLSWTYDNFEICAGKTYKFRLYRDNSSDYFAQINANTGQTTYVYSDPQTPTSTTPENRSYKIRVIMVNGAGTLYHSSDLSGPAIGHPLPLPPAPNNLAITYQGCAGNIKLNWQNPQIYSSMLLRLTTTGGVIPDIIITGSPSSWEGMIDPGTTYTAELFGYDNCNQSLSSAVLANIRVPEAPGGFTLSPPVEDNGSISLNWEPAADATSYKIIRTGDGSKEYAINDPGITEFLDSDVKICTQYSYKVMAYNNCGNSSTDILQAPVIQQSFNVWTNQRLSASKGYFGNRVELEWQSPNTFGFDHFKILKRTLGSNSTPQFLATVNKNELRYVDHFAPAGVLNEYFISAYSECNGVINESTALSDAGFRLPIATITGNVKFQNGTGVDSVIISVERNSGALGKGLHFNGQGSMTVHPDYTSDPLSVLNLSPQMTIELWIKPDQLANDFTLFSYSQGDNSYGLYFDAMNQSLVQYFTNVQNGISKSYPVNLSTGVFTHIAWARNMTNLALYINGQPKPGTEGTATAPGSSSPLTFGGGYAGYLDEIRFWSKRRTTAEISMEYRHILRGDESHLVGYWRIDEGVGNGVYDISGVDEIFNARHLQINSNVTWVDQFPAVHQLGNAALTDSVGNYIVKNIRYSGTGNTFTVIPFYSPGGTPHEFDPVSTVLFLGEGNSVQNAVNFIDKSSFFVTGTIIYSYPDSMCLNTQAFIYIDDQVAQVNGMPATVNPNGTFAIDVPIGRHRLSIKQAGHVFHHQGFWPIDGSLYDFQKDESGITFYDSTVVRVIGRVVGGTREGNKKLGFGKSTNNIGQAVLTFTSQNGCHQLVVLTDASGEYQTDLLPFKYNVNISVPGNLGLSFGTLGLLDLSIIRPTLHEVDTIFNFAGQPVRIDSVRYNIKQNYIYRAVPEVDVMDAITGGPIRGDSIFIFIHQDTRDTTIIPLQDLPYPVFFAGKKYPTIISAFERYINYDGHPLILEDRVPITDASVTINNGLGNAGGTGQAYEEKFDIRNAEGNTPYTFIGGQPEFTAEGNQLYDFTQILDLQLTTPQHTVSWRAGMDPFRGYVLGVKPVVGASFITEGPEMVDYILRDPPGGSSSAKFLKGETYTDTKSWFLNNSLTIGTGAKLKAGLQWFIGGGIVGIGFDSEVKNDNNFKLALKTSTNFDGEYTESITFEEEIATSSDPSFPGDASDIFMGKSQNFLFGGADELTLVSTNTCNLITACIGPEIMVDGQSYRLGRRDNLFLVPLGFKTTFIYTQLQIKDYLIPNIKSLRNALFTSGPYNSHLLPSDARFGLNNDDPAFGSRATSPTPEITEEVDYDGDSYTYTPPAGEAPNDRIRWYNQQIRLWENALARNEREKFFARQTRNVSFDAGATLSYTSTHKKANKHSEKFEVNLNTEAALWVGFTIGGSGGEFAFTLGLEVASGGSFSQQTEVTNTYGYTLADGQPGDFFSIDVKDDLVGNGPVFSLRGGQSMCPWEQGYITEYYNPGTPLSQSTIRRELPDIDVEPSFRNNVPEHQPARYVLKLRNASPTGDIQWYGLRILDQTNPNGAVLKIDGASPNRVFEIPAGQTILKTLELYKGTVDEYEIKLMLYSTCEYEAFQNGAEIFATDTITVYAQFVPACSPVSIMQPVDQWIHNVNQGNTLPIQLRDYQVNDPNLEQLRIQYKPSFTSTWNGLTTIWKTRPSGSEDPEIPPGSSFMTYTWNIDELPDGPYDIRVVSHCTNTNNDYASPHVSGIVDRLRPHAFGNPQPADGVLDPNDEIMIQFNEPINPASVSVLDFDIRAVLNGAPLRHETSIQLDGINDHVIVPAGTRIGSHAFTFELWVRRLSNGAQLLWSQGEKSDTSMAIGFNATNKLFFRWHNNTIISNATITADGQWHHIAVTCNENRQVNFFHTGLISGSGTVDSLWSIPGTMVFGKTAWANLFLFKGYMHQARIWRTELTEGAIRTQMLKRLSGVEAGLSMLWPMDEGMGSKVHEVVRKKHATLLGNWSVLPSGYSLAFNGNDEIKVNAGTMVFSRQHHFTIEFWMKGGPTGTTQTLISNGRGDGTDENSAGWSISLHPDGRLLVYHGGQTFTAITKTILDNNWHHVALVLNRQGNLNTYLNGLLQTSIFGDAFGEFAGSALWIGNRGWYEGITEMHDQYFSGLLDEVRVWNTKMTADFIRASMSNRLQGDEFGLQLYLPFESYEEMGGIPILSESLADASPFQRTLTVSGDPLHNEEDPNIKLAAPFEKINFTYSISNDRILITPTTDPLRIEKTVLFISVRNIQDLNGNNLAGPITWTAFVNKNQLQWANDEFYFEKPEKEGFEFTADIVNSGGIELSYEVLGLPDWLTATPAVGSINPVSTKAIRFSIHPDVHIGDYSTDINLLSGTGYNDKLSIDLHVFGVPPAWHINPADYQHSMTIVADLDIRGELSADPLDRVAAYINGEVRGLATMEYIPSLDRYLAFLVVYSNVMSGEQVTFKVWDASTGTTYAGVKLKNGTQENLQIPYVTNTLVGNVVTPARWIVTADIIQEIQINEGWSWISFNVLSTKFGNLDLFFAELNFENNDEIQSQTKTASYNPSSGWQGNLKNEGLDIRKMYKCNFSYADILRVVGPRVNPNAYPISIAKNWNWIPYLSSQRIEVNEAMSSFQATTGDILKSQNQVAVYHPTQGWVGTLRTMMPGMGYMLFAGNSGSIVYPLAAIVPPIVESEGRFEHFALDWRSGGQPSGIVPQAYNMTLVARLQSDIQFDQPPTIAAISGSQLLQVAEGMRHTTDGDILYYFTLQGYEKLPQIHFEVYNHHGHYAGVTDEKVFWNTDLMLGDHNEPFILHLTEKPTLQFEVYPNPFDHDLHITLETTGTGKAEMYIMDAQGKQVHYSVHTFLRPGLQYFGWNGKAFDGRILPSGTYFLQVIHGDQVYHKKLIKP